MAFFVCVGSEDHGIHLMLLWVGMLSRDGISYTGHMLTLGHSRREIRSPHLDHSTLFLVLVQTHVCVEYNAGACLPLHNLDKVPLPQKNLRERQDWNICFSG